MFLKWINRCRLCGNPHFDEVIDLGEMYSQGFFIYKDKPAPPMRKIPTRIVRCDTQKWEDGCGLVQNKVIVPSEILYSNYGYSSSINPHMVNHLKLLYEKIIEIKSNLLGQIVCDIGMNDGTFLKFFGQGVKKIGIDPSDISKNVSGDIKVINECFPTKKLNRLLTQNSIIRESNKVTVFTAFACLYDMIDLEKTLLSIEECLAEDGIFVFEVAYLPTVLRDLCYDGMVHEHISLFSLTTLEYALNKVGLRVFKLEKTLTNSGSLLVFACKKNCEIYDNENNINTLKQLRIEEFEAKIDDPKTYESFRNRVNQHSIDLKTLLIKFKNEGKKIHIYGASTKLNTILSFVGIGPELIDCAAERDPKKWGGRLLNGIPMVSEEESRKNVDVYLIGPYHFRQEIIKREQQLLDRKIKFLFPLPQIDLI